MQCRRIHPFLQAEEALVQQIARSALSARSCVQFSSTQPSSCQQCTHTGKSTYSASQATVKSFRNRCVNQVELRKVSQRNLAVIIRTEALKISGVVDGMVAYRLGVTLGYHCHRRERVGQKQEIESEWEIINRILWAPGFSRVWINHLLITWANKFLLLNKPVKWFSVICNPNESWPTWLPQWEDVNLTVAIRQENLFWVLISAQFIILS